MLIILKRFQLNFNNNTIDKINYFFQFPLEIDFNNYITIANKKDNTNNNSLDKLKGFTVNVTISPPTS